MGKTRGGDGGIRRVYLHAHVAAGADRGHEEGRVGCFHGDRDVLGVHHASWHDVCAGVAGGDPVRVLGQQPHRHAHSEKFVDVYLCCRAGAADRGHGEPPLLFVIRPNVVGCFRHGSGASLPHPAASSR
jgi:hypothetical protein